MLSEHDPGAECIMSEANEDKTTGDIREMGGRLAEEVTAFLRKKMDKASKSGGYRNINLSFVGHSIGNIIIRSALEDSLMEPYLKYLKHFIQLRISRILLQALQAEDTGVLQEHNSYILTTGISLF
ncbi:hypothetical protein MRB53_016169 [Persea americana]|uniref:Uncharacterized protein n=1 Tax=Persea americana TaxID=3435 RepID=A0ACC2M1E0_PERAE|nr:hypothetical protein MRB53_016169 [Persea americana]